MASRDDRRAGEPGHGPNSTGYRAAWTSPLVRRLWTAAAASVVGDYIGLGALLFLSVDRTGQAVGAAGVLAIGVVPTLLTGIVAGSWLDRLPRIATMVALQILGAAVICLPVVFDGIAVVYVTAALLAVTRTAMIGVRSGAMAEGLPDEHRGPLIALLSSTDQAGQVLGYLLGGTLYVTLGTEVALLTDAASLLLGAAVLATIRLPRSHAAGLERPGPTTGMRIIARDPVLRLLAVLVAFTAAVSSLPEVLAPVVAAPGDPWRPFVLAAAPLGQAVTMTVIGRTRQVRRPSVQLAHLGWLVLALGITALGRGPAWLAFGNLLIGSGVAWLVGPQLTFLRLAPPGNMAQVTATMVALLALADGVGSLAYAWIADTAGVQVAYRSAAIVLLCVAAVGWLVKERTPDALALDRDELPDRPHGRSSP